MKKALCLVALAAAFLTACEPIHYKTVTNAKLGPPQKELNTFDAVTAALLSRGFDIKFASKDIGAVTTEFKQYGSVGGSPPFDFYLQIKTQITKADGKDFIVFTPLERSVNRLNSAAYTERDILFVEKSEQATNLKTRQVGFNLFMNVVQDVATSAGLSIDQVKIETRDHDEPNPALGEFLNAACVP